MKTVVMFLPEAISDQSNIKKYLSQFYPGTSQRFFSLLKKKIGRLKAYPYSCPVYEDDAHFFDVTPHDNHTAKDELPCYCIAWRSDDTYE